jgi:hypothetical protein
MECREIWFERWHWRYIPCHWKGWALLAVFAFAFNAIGWILDWLVNGLGRPEWEWVPFLIFVPGVLWLAAIAERHTAKRS